MHTPHDEPVPPHMCLFTALPEYPHWPVAPAPHTAQLLSDASHEHAAPVGASVYWFRTGHETDLI